MAIGIPIRIKEKLEVIYFTQTFDIAIAIDEAETAVTLYSILTGSTSTFKRISCDFIYFLNDM